MATAESAERALPSGIFSQQAAYMPHKKSMSLKSISLSAQGAWRGLSRADTQLRRVSRLRSFRQVFLKTPTALRRFEQEARAAAAVNHPTYWPFHHLGRHEGQPYIRLRTLEVRHSRGAEKWRPLPMRKAGAYAIQIAGG